MKPGSFGVDFSGKSAFLAAVNEKEVLAQIEIRLSDNPWQFRNDVKDWLVRHSQDMYRELWIEQPFVAGGRFPQVALQLVRTAAFLEIAAMDASIEPCFVHPMTWRKAIYGNGRVTDTKAAARQVAEEILGFKPKFKNQHNICEGMLIAYYGHIQHHPENVPEQARFKTTGAAR